MKRMLGIGTVLGAAFVLMNVAPARADEPAPSTVARAQEQIQVNLHSDHNLANNHIDVRVSPSGVATLRGTVDSETERRAAVGLASVVGVRVIDNQLKVGNATVSEVISDIAINSEVQDRLVANGSLRDSGILVTTDDGVVTLTGTVASPEQRGLAVNLVRHTNGVRGVNDRTRIEAVGSTPSDPEVPLH
jgi:osmotically-inducible protein OsmY